MYQLPSIYSGYYKDYINRNVRQFKLECSIKSGAFDVSISEDKISSVLIENDLLSGAEEYTIGNLASGKLTMVVSSDVQVFETNIITLTLKLRAQDIYGTEIWIPIPLGRFHVFNVSSTKLSKTINAYDDLYKIELEQQFESKLEYPTTTHKVIEELCGILNIGFDTASTPNWEIERPSVVIDVVIDDEGKRELVETDSNQVCFGLKVGKALSCIATYLGGNFIIDGDSKLKFVEYPKDIIKSYDFTRFAMPTTNSASYNIKRITCTGYTEKAIEAKIDDSTGTSMDLDSPFVDQGRLLQILNDLSNIPYQQTKVKVKGDPTLQLGDLIELYELDNNLNIINRMTIPILRMNFSYTGGCSNDIEAPCKVETEKTINYKGTITSRLDNLEGTVSNTGNEIEKLNRTLAALSSIKDNIDTMDLFIDSLSTQLNANKVSQYNLILNQIEQSSDNFDKQYLSVYNNKYLL